MLLLALNGIFGSQTAFMYNRIQSVWQDSAHGTVHIAMLTYTNELVQSIDDVSFRGTNLVLVSFCKRRLLVEIFIPPSI